jgi:hypothetical protein
MVLKFLGIADFSHLTSIALIAFPLLIRPKERWHPQHHNAEKGAKAAPTR